MSKQKGFAVISGSSSVVAKIMENGTVVFGENVPVNMRISGTLVLDLEGQVGGAGKVLHVDANGSASLAQVSAANVTTTGDSNVQTVLNSLSSSLSSEASSRVSGDSSLTTKIGADVAAAVSALVDGAPDLLNTLNELAAAIGDDANYATTITNAVGSVNTKVGSVQTVLTNSISSETSARESADISLTSALSIEASSLTSVDVSLNSALSGEVSSRTSADTSLTNALSSETSIRTSVDTSLNSALSSETSTRTSADTSLNSALSSETSIRTSADESLAAALSSEVSAIDAVLIVGTAGEIKIGTGAGNETGSVGLSGTITIGLPDDVTIAGNLTVNGNATLGNAVSDQVTVAGKFRVGKMNRTEANEQFPLGNDASYNGNMFYLDAADGVDPIFAQGQKWYFCEDAEWFASPFYAV